MGLNEQWNKIVIKREQGLKMGELRKKSTWGERGNRKKSLFGGTGGNEAIYFRGTKEYVPQEASEIYHICHISRSLFSETKSRDQEINLV